MEYAHDDRLNIGEMRICVFDRIVNTLEKRENAGKQHFLLFSHCSEKLSLPKLLTLKVPFTMV